jgi:hypothetical protein
MAISVTLFKSGNVKCGPSVSLTIVDVAAVVLGLSRMAVKGFLCENFVHNFQYFPLRERSGQAVLCETG